MIEFNTDDLTPQQQRDLADEIVRKSEIEVKGDCTFDYLDDILNA